MKVLKYIVEAILIYFIFLFIKIIGLNMGRKFSAYVFLKIGK